MADPFTWQITDGVLAFKAVDPLAVGYLPTWNAPGGKTSTTVTMADYETGSATWRCQVTRGILTPSANSEDLEIEATFCSAARTTTTPKQSRWTLDVDIYQDPQVPTAAPAGGLAEYTYKNDAKEVYFMLGLNGTTLPPRAIGRIVMTPTAFGGPARIPLTSPASWQVTQWPDIKFGVLAALEDADEEAAATSGRSKQKSDA
jgi:hypothetical protein